MNKVFLLLIGFLLIGFSSALPTDSDVDLTFNYPINQSTLNVNNTEYFQGYTPTSLYTYYKGLLETYFDGLYCKLTGCTMTGNLNVEANVSAYRYTTIENSSNGICTNSSGDTFFGYIEGAC